MATQCEVERTRRATAACAGFVARFAKTTAKIGYVVVVAPERVGKGAPWLALFCAFSHVSLLPFILSSIFLLQPTPRREGEAKGRGVRHFAAKTLPRIKKPFGLGSGAHCALTFRPAYIRGASRRWPWPRLGPVGSAQGRRACTQPRPPARAKHRGRQDQRPGRLLRRAEPGRRATSTPRRAPAM